MANLFLKTFDPLLMNGFKNKKELEDYWFYSQLGTGLVAMGFLMILISEVINNLNKLNLFTISSISIIYLVIFSVILSIPFITNRIFIKLLSQSLPYWYVKYMWANSRSAILVIMSELPEDILCSDDLVKLHQHTNEEDQISILIRTWHKNLNNKITNKLKKIN